MQRYQGKIDAFHHQVQVLTDQASLLKPKPNALCAQLQKLSRTINEYHDITEYLDDYFVLDEAQESTTRRLTDQMEALQNGKCHFSPEPYLALIQKVAKFSKTGASHKTHTKNTKLIEEIDKKTAFQTQQCRDQLEEFMEELIPAMRAEAEEATAQWNVAYEQWQRVPLENNRKALVDAQIARNAITEACATLYNQITEANVPDKLVNRKDLHTIRDLQKRLETLPTPPQHIVSEAKEAFLGYDLAERLNSIRQSRVTISKAQQKREWTQREFEKLDQEGPPSRNLFLHSFFFYLQAITPVLGAFTTPIAKQDYDFCLKMMAKTSQTANPVGESYDDYLAKARSFIGIDHDFLDHYDQFLRGQMQFSYNPMPTEPTAPTGVIDVGKKTTVETIHEWIEGVAPSSVADWTASILGLSPNANTSAWDQWIQSAIYPQVKDNYFSGIINYFEQLDPLTPAPVDGDAALFGHHCYQMYQSLKASDGQEAFQLNLYQAKQFSEYKTFLQDYQQYLQNHLPEGDQKTIIIKEPLSTRIATLPVSAKASMIQPSLLHDPLVRSAVKTSGLFDISLSDVISHIYNVFTGGPVAQRIPHLERHIANLETMHEKLSLLNQELPLLAKHEGTQPQIEKLTTRLSELIIIQKTFQPAPDETTMSTTEVQDWLKSVNAYCREVDSVMREFDSLNVVKQAQELDILRKMIESSPLLISESDLLHIIGDPFGKGTGLEGAQAARSLELRMGLLKAKLHALESSPNNNDLYKWVGLKRPNDPIGLTERKLIKQLQKALDLHTAMQHGTISIRLAEALSKASPGEPVLLPGGWAGTPSGHAIYYEFTKQANGQFAVRLYNTGAGLKHHPKYIQESKQKAVTFIEHVNVPIDNILSPLLLRALLELDWPTTFAWDESDIYQTVLTALGGQPSSHVYQEDDLRTPQRAGTCAFMALATALSYRMEYPRSFLKFEFEMEFKALVDYAHQHKNRIEKGEELPWRLLSKSLAEFSRDVLEFHKRGVINDLEQVYAAGEIERLQEMVKRGEISHTVETRQSAYSVDLEGVESPQILRNNPANIKPIENPSPDLPPASLIVRPISIRNWTPVPDTLHSDLEMFHSQMQSVFETKDYSTVLATFENLAERLPLSQDQLDLWRSVGWENSEAVIHSLASISEIAFHSQLHLASTESIHKDTLAPKRLVNFMKIFTICHQLAQRAPEPFQIPPGAFYSQKTMKYITDESLYFRTYDSSTDNAIQDIFNCWENSGTVWPFLQSGLPTSTIWETMIPDSLEQSSHKWLAPIMKDPQVHAALASRFPLFAGFSDGARLAIAFADTVVFNGNEYKNTRDILPKFFYDLHDLMYINAFLSSHQLQVPSANKEIHKIQHKAIKSYGWSLMPDTNLPLKSANSIENAHRHLPDKLTKNILMRRTTYFERRDPDFEMRLEETPYSKWPVPLQQRRELRNLIVDRHTQVKETLAYFMSPLQAHLLTNPDYQLMFSILFFEPKLLVKELQGPVEDVEHFITTANTFFESRFKSYSEIGKWQIASYYLGLNHLFKAYVDYAVQHRGLELSQAPQLLDTQREILSIFESNQTLNGEDQAYLNFELALTFDRAPKLDLNSATQFLSAAIIYHNQKSTLKNPPGRERERVLESIIDRFREDLANLAAGPERDLLLNQVAKTIDSSFQAQAWKPLPGFPRFVTADGSCAIDMLEAKVYKHIGGTIRLDQTIIDHPVFEQVFGKGFNVEATQVGGATFQFTGNDGTTYRVQKVGSGIILQMLLDHDGQVRWYQLVPQSELSAEIKPALILDNIHWYAPDSREMLIYQSNSEIPSYAVKPKDGKFQVHRLDSSGVATGLTLSDTPSYYVSNFENPDFVLNWLSPKGKASTLELPRFNLTFTVKEGPDGPRAYCDDMPGFSLAKVQWVEALADYPYRLVLENSSGQKKVLLPKQSLKSDQNRIGSLETRKMTLDRELDSPHQQFFEYSVEKSTGRLIPANDLGRFYLGMVQLWRMEYLESMRTLRGYEASLAPFSPEEVDALTKITKLREKSKDNDPRALTIYLYAAYLLKKNAADFPESPAAEFKLPDKPGGIVASYLQVADKSAEVRLTPDEEIRLFLGADRQALYRLHQAAELRNVNQILQIHESPKLSSITLSNPSNPLSLKACLTDNDLSFLVSKKSGTQNSANSASVLSPPFIDHFIPFYKMAKGELSNKEFQERFKRLVGVTLPPSFDQKESMSKLLVMAEGIVKRWPTNDLRTAYAILQAVLQEPARFPQLESLMDIKIHQKAIIGTAIEVVESIKRDPDDIRNSVLILSDTKEAPTIQKTEMPFEQCIAPYSPSTLAQPVIQDLSSCIEVIPLPAASMEKAYRELNALFAISTTDRVANNEFARIRDNLKTYQKRDIKEEFYRISDASAFANLRGDLEATIVQGEIALENHAVTVLEMANKAPSIDLKTAQRELEHVGQGRQTIDIDQLAKLFLTRDMDRFHQANPELTLEDIHLLNHEMMNYLIESTHLQHLKRICSQMDEIQTMMSQASEGELNQKLQQFSAAASSKRAYEVENNPEYLVFEHYMNILIRPDQVENLNLLRIDNGKIGNPEKIGVVLEMIMGAGKTDILLPLLGMLNADGDSLSIGILPEALLPSMVQRLTERLGTSFGQSVEVLNYSRDQKLSEDDLMMLRLRLEEIRVDRKMLFMTPSTTQSLFLTFIETWYDYSDGNEEMLSKLDLLRDIFRLFKEKGRVILDESDLILNARKEHHFNRGTPQPLATSDIELSTFLYETLLNPSIINDMRFDFGASNADAAPFTPEDFKQKITQRLIEQTLDHQFGMSSDASVSQFFNSLEPLEKEYLKSYLSSIKDPSAQEFVRNLSNPQIKDLLALAKEQINTLIPLTANKIMHVHYGLLKDSKVPIAIPYHGSNNPAKRAQFGEYETLNYSIQTALGVGISSNFVLREIEELQHQAVELIKRGKPYEASETQKRFNLVSQNDPTIKLFGVEHNIELLTEKINQNVELKLYFAQKYVLPNIVRYPITLSIDPQLFNFIFGQVCGFTGTQWNADTFPDKLEIIQSDVATAKTLALLWRNSHDEVHVLPQLDPKHLAKQLIGDNVSLQGTYAIIDTGGAGRGITNEMHARQMLDLPSNTNREPSIVGVVFYDEEDHLMVLKRGEDTPTSLKHATLSIDQRCTFYDQKHTTGADIKQPFTASAVVTIGKHTTLRDLLQSVWRMRGLDSGQKVAFAMDEETKQILISTLENMLGQKVSEPILLQHILLFVTYNQAIQQGDNNFRSLKQKIKTILKEAVWHSVLDKNVLSSDLKGIFEQVDELFVTRNPTCAWDLFGLPQEDRDSTQVVEELVSATQDSKAFEALTTDPILTAAVDITKIEQQIKNTVDRALPTLPDQLPAIDRPYGIQAELEAEKEKEQRKELHVEIEGEVYSNANYLVDDYKNPELADLQRWDFFNADSAEKVEEPYIEIGDDDDDFGRNRRPAPMVSFVSVEQALANEPNLAEFRDVFDSNMIATTKLIRQGEREKWGTHPYAVFNYFQKSSEEILIVQNKKSGQLKFVLNDPLESGHFHHLLDTDSKASQSAGETRLCLYKIGYGPYRQGHDRIDMASMEKDPNFLRPLVQVKFFNGEVDYTSTELPHLEAWIKEQGVERMERLFSHIIEWKALSRRGLPNSTLGDIFRGF